ncbi:MAG: YwiC-like family protein [Acidimicrobiales bacterium]|nr:YwiC-like family protein [Acidimicrobiales bacterium]
MTAPARATGAAQRAVADTPRSTATDPAGAERSPAPAGSASGRRPWKAVALPAEHGGWGLTLEPCLLGLLVAPSIAGAALATATFLAFLVRTPLKLALIDRRRGRRLERTALATRIAVVESVVLVGLAVLATALAGPRLWMPVVAAAPLVAVEAWYEVRSRGRRLVPELAGAIGVSAAATAIAIAGGAPLPLAFGLWLVLGARGATSIPQVRAQISSLHGRAVSSATTTAGDLAALAFAAVAVALDPSLLAGALAIAAIVVIQRVSARRPTPAPKVVGLRQLALGLALVLITAVGTFLA